MNNDANLRKIRKKFNGLATIPYKDLPGPVGEYCDKVADLARRYAPVDKGELRDAIEVERPGEFNRFSGDDNITSAVVVNSDHAAAVEYGTYFTDAHPFLRPAIASSGGSDRLKAFVKEGIRDGLKRVKGG